MKKVNYEDCIVYDLQLERASRWRSLHDVFEFLVEDRENEGEDMSEYINADEENMLALVDDMDFELRSPTADLLNEYEERYAGQ